MKQTIYQATKGSSLVNYCIFNKTNEETNSNKFLSALLKSLNHEEWFSVSSFLHLELESLKKSFTQVPFADKTVQREEFETLTKTFTDKEIKEITTIIKSMNLTGVFAIKELMDNDQDIPKINLIKNIFFNPFALKRRI